MSETLQQYIDRQHDGIQSRFAASQGVKPPQVTQWIRKGFIVSEGVLYSPRRTLKDSSG